MTTIRHALVMAAGRGVRMMPLTAVIPKPMAPYNGTTLIADGIRKLRRSIPYIHITVGYKGPTLAEHVIDLGVSSVLNTDGKGNAWWVYNTLISLLDEPIFLLTCDNVAELDFDELAADYFALGAPPCMVIPVRPVEGLEGDYISRDGNVVTKLDRQAPTDRYCSGIQILNPAAINARTESVEDFYPLWNQLIARRELYCSRVFPQHWSTVDTLAQLDHLCATAS